MNVDPHGRAAAALFIQGVYFERFWVDFDVFSFLQK